MSSAREIQARGERVVNRRLDKLGKGLALEALSRLMDKTPVDRGRARANWNVKRGGPNRETTESTDELLTMSKGQAVISDFRLSKEELWLSNNLPYIERLENGWSKQAPQGMARITVRELEPVARKIARQVRMSGG